MTADFTLSVLEAERAADDFMDLGASVSCRGFSGRTSFTISRRDVDRFLADAAGLSTGAADAAQLLGGWDDADERLRFRVTRAGVSGQYVARVRIATTGPRSDQWNRVETEFVCRPEALSSFLSGVAGLDSQRPDSAASLAGDSGAIA
jgi:hypothetical protein